MAKTTKKSRTLATLTYPVKVEVREPEFELLDSVRLLDVAALSKAKRAQIEVGYVKTSCCQHLVRAVIRNGMVIGLEVQAPSGGDRTPVSPELTKLLKAAQRASMARREAGPRYPMPVGQFLTGAIADIKTISCIQICLFHWCISCCWRTDEPSDNLFCGKITIDGTNSPYPE